MNQINIKHVTKSFEDHMLFSDITFQVNQKDRIGIVGANGAVKSTLLHMIQGQEDFDSGHLEIAKHEQIELLEQDHDFSEEGLSYLSGGERTKLALQEILYTSPGILLLDEPTNHLDFDSIKWLIKQMDHYNGTIIIVSHDRYFLDAIVTRIIEIDHGTSHEYHGNYSYYRDEKKRLYEEQLERYENDRKRQQEIKQTIMNLEQWSRQAHHNSTKKDSSRLTMGVKERKRAKAKKMDNQVKSQKKRLEKLITRSEVKPLEETNVYFRIENAGSHGKRILEANNIAKSFDNTTLFEDSSFTILSGEKVALFGPNGCGKTTFLRALLKELTLDNGELWLSPSCRSFILSQTFLDLPEAPTVMTYLTEQHGTLLVVSHDIYFINQICDHMLLFSDKQIRRLESCSMFH